MNRYIKLEVGTPSKCSFIYSYCTKLCADVYKEISGEKITEDFINARVKETAEYFSGVENIDHAIFVNGSVDPWSTVGFTKKEQAPKATVIFIQGLTFIFKLNMYARLCQAKNSKIYLNAA